MAHLPTTPGVVIVDSVRSALHDFTNVHVWEVLAAVVIEPAPVLQLAERVSLQQPTVSKHLRRLQDHMLVSFVRRKNEHVFHVNSDLVHQRNGFIVVRFRDDSGMRATLIHPVHCA